MSDELKVQVVRYPDRECLVLRWRDPLSGKMKSQSAKTTDRKQAMRAAGVLQAELASGKHQPVGKLTWQAFRERLEAEYYPSLSVASQKICDTVLAAVERILAPQKLAAITNEKLSYFASQLRCETPERSEATITKYNSRLLTMLRWAHDLGMLTTPPKLSKASRAKGKQSGKARAVTAEEFERMLAVVPRALAAKDRQGNPVEATPAMVEAWRLFLRGLWLSGFRLGEGFRLSWTDETAPHIDLSGKRAVVRFPAGSQKNGREETWACPPDFAELLASIPEEERRGRVFKLFTFGSDHPCLEYVMQIVGDIGEAAGVVVSKTGGKVKYASAHDLRRAFCTRWARMVMPQVLTRLARHSSIQTTMAYYVTQSAEDTADVAYQAWERQNATQVTNQVTTEQETHENSGILR